MGVRGQQSVPSVVLGAEMAGASLYGSFRAGLSFGSGDASVANYGSRWGIKGSHEVSEGLTASYKFEGAIDMTNAESFGGNDSILASVGSNANDPTATLDGVVDPDDATKGKKVSAGGPGGRISSISLSGGFGTVTLGQFWSASANHYGFAVDPTNFNGKFGGTTFRPGNQVSYSSSAGDVSFQIDKVTGGAEKIEFGASATLGPVGVGLGYWSNDDDDASFTGVAISAGAGGVGLAVGLGSSNDADGMDSDTSIISVSGALGDSGISYGVQIANGDTDASDQNVVSLVNTLGSGAAIHFEHVDPGVGDAKSHIVLKVDF